jgi:hypothetical protein
MRQAMPHVPGAKFPDERSPPDRVEPGTFGCHEALHLASTFMIMVEQHLAEHPAIRANSEWDALATTAVTALADLSHAIHKAHLSARQSAQMGEDQPPSDRNA